MWSALIAGVSDLIGSGVSSASATKQAKLQYKHQSALQEDQQKYNAEQAELAYNRQLDFWRTQQEYNTPANQRARLTEAGLNPALLYGGGASGVSTAGGLSSVSAAQSSQGSAAAGSPTFPKLNPLTIAQIGEIESRRELNEAQADNLRNTTPTAVQFASRYDLENQILSATRDNQQLDKAIREFDLAMKIDTREATVNKAWADLYLVKQTWRKLAEDMQTADLDQNLKQQYIMTAGVDATIKALELKYFEDNGTTMAAEEVQRIRSEVMRNAAEANNLNETTDANFWSRVVGAIGGVAITAATISSGGGVWKFIKSFFKGQPKPRAIGFGSKK